MSHPYSESGSGFCGRCDAMPGEGVHAPTPKEGVGGSTPLSTFYLTFGIMYSHTTHPTWRWAHPDGHVKVIAENEEAARDLVRRAFGTWWAFLYTEEDFSQGRGMAKHLATIYEDGSASVERWVDNGNAEPPTARFGTSDPQYWGRAPYESACIRVEGRLIKDPSDEMYDVEYIHHHCVIEGVALFDVVVAIDGSVQAAELDWANRYECPACNTSITSIT